MLHVFLYPDIDTDNQVNHFEKEDLEIYERRYSEGYDIYIPHYYKWLKSTYISYAEEWYHKVVRMIGSSSQAASQGTSEPSTKLEQSVMQDSSGSSIGEGNKDLEKYIRRYEEGYNLYDPQYYAWLQCTHPSYAKRWYQTAVKIGSASSEQETEVESSDMPGSSGLSSTGPSNKNIQSNDNEYITNHLFNFVSLQITSSHVIQVLFLEVLILRYR